MGTEADLSGAVQFDSHCSRNPGGGRQDGDEQ